MTSESVEEALDRIAEKLVYVAEGSQDHPGTLEAISMKQEEMANATVCVAEALKDIAFAIDGLTGVIREIAHEALLPRERG